MRNVLFTIAIFVLCASAAFAGGGYVPGHLTQVSNHQSPVGFFPSVDPAGGFWATQSGKMVHLSDSGVVDKVTNMSGKHPTAFGGNMAYYANDDPSILSSGGIYQPVQGWIGQPLSPIVIGSSVYFSSSKGIILWSDGAGYDFQIRFNADWWLNELAYGGGKLIAVAQNIYDPVYDGYHTFTVDLQHKSVTEIPAMRGYQRVAASGDTFLFTDFTNTHTRRYDMVNGQLIWREDLHDPTTVTLSVGGMAANGRFALQGFAGNLYEYRVVPEPGSLLVLGAGMLGLAGGYRLRRK